MTYVRTSLYTSGFFLRSSNQLCLGRLAYRGYLFGLDESVTEKTKRGFAFRMYVHAERKPAFDLSGNPFIKSE